MMTEVSEKRFCDIHGEYTAAAASIMGRVFQRQCPGCMAKIENAKREAEANREAERLKLKIEHAKSNSQIPKRFQTCTFDNFHADNPGQEKALRVAKAYASDWKQANADGRCLIFSGKAGTGKTHLACAIANKLTDNAVMAKFFTVTGLLRSIKESFNKDATITESEAIESLAQIDLLILDEAGMDYGTDFNKTLMFEVLNRRYENMKPTIVMTNLDAGALKEYFGDRILDRMREGGGKMIAFNWESQRK